jgi:transcriptional antiterminator NusG
MARWYIIHAYSGFEKKVAVAIAEQAEKKGMKALFEEIVVPTESVVEIKTTQTKNLPLVENRNYILQFACN